MKVPCHCTDPPFFQIVTFWDDWKMNYTPVKRTLKIALNVVIILIGFFAIGEFGSIVTAVNHS